MFGLTSSKKKSDKAKILIVDDEIDCVSIVQCRLEWCHYDVITATNGKEGLEKAASEKPDLILLDTNMPVINGHEMLERMRNDQAIKDTPVIMVTALCDAKDIDMATSLGISDYVTKPIDFEKLIEKISNILSKKTSCSAKR
ncbi:MAG: response regulator [Sedimentisphaerales bacterium]|nr:response regulator [Sedimentisphaerales bacterium]